MTRGFSLSASMTLPLVFQCQLEVPSYVHTYIFGNLLVSLCILCQQRNYSIQFLIVTRKDIPSIWHNIVLLPIFRLFLLGGLGVRMLQGLFTPTSQRALPFARLLQWLTLSSECSGTV